MAQQPLTLAIEICGLVNIARACGVTSAAVHKWRRYGLPQSEWTTGGTVHSKRIERATGGRVTREMLLATLSRPARTKRTKRAQRAAARAAQRA